MATVYHPFVDTLLQRHLKRLSRVGKHVDGLYLVNMVRDTTLELRMEKHLGYPFHWWSRSPFRYYNSSYQILRLIVLATEVLGANVEATGVAEVEVSLAGNMRTTNDSHITMRLASSYRRRPYQLKG